MLLKEKLTGWKLMLASASPRRRELMEACGLDFTLVEPYHVEETYPPDLPASDVAVFLSHLKSSAYPLILGDREILITADTTVVLDGRKIIGKPVDRAHALEMLGELNGRSHTVITGVTMRSAARECDFSARTDVTFRRLTSEELEYYVDNYKPYDKAGAYGIQEWIGYAGIERIEGSFYNVMGLPVQKLYVNLENFIK